MDSTENKNQGWQRILFIIIPYIFIVGIFQFIGFQIAGVDLTNDEFQKTSTQQIIITFFSFLGTFLLLWIFMKWVDKEKFIQLGFQTKNRSIEFIYGIGLGLLIMTIGYVLLLYLKEIFFIKIVFTTKELFISIVHFTLVAVLEEALFRGYILKNLMVSFNKYVALIVSSLLFSLMHYFNPNIDWIALLNLFLAGILFGISYIHTRNLWFPIAFHLSWNLFQALLGFNVSGRDSYSIVEFKIYQDNILNGGDFGFEGSILSIIAQVAAILGIAIYYNQKKTSHNNGYNPPLF